MDDPLLNEFVSESREHLATIEADLLAIEEGGTDIDEDLVNKVFRAAHSLKGGSGFLGLTQVKELAHRAETVLDMLRSRKMTPNAEVTNVLLAAFDKLREMINNPREIETIEITDLVVGLTGLASSYLPLEQKASLTQTVQLQPQGAATAVTLAQVDFERATRAGQCVYSISYDLIHDIEKKGLSILRVFRELEESGDIMDCALDLEAAGTLDGPIGNSLPLRLIFASTLAPQIFHELVCVPPANIQMLSDPVDAQFTIGKTAANTNPTSFTMSMASSESNTQNPSEVHQPEPTPPVRERPTHSEPGVEQPSISGSAQSTSEDTLRVSVGVLEALMNLAGELV
jgi:two-component system, chemotaxis family, sensor kinase CheA